MSEISIGAGERSLDRILSLEREIARLRSWQLREVSAFGERRGAAGDVVAELALTLSISERAARRKLGVANSLVSRLPKTLAAMERGEIDAVKASAIAEVTECLSDNKARAVDVLLTGTLAGKDPGRIRRLAARAVRRVDPTPPNEPVGVEWKSGPARTAWPP